MQVHFIRHGAAISNDPRLTEAQILEPRFLDAPLNDHGRQQARAAGIDLAKALNGAVVDLVLVSPLERALETAELILSSAGIATKVSVIEVLREAHGVRPCDARRQRSVAAARFPSFDFSAVETEADTWHNASVRETVQALRLRCQQFEHMLRALPLRNVVVVSHGVFLEHLLEGSLGACISPPTPPGQVFLSETAFLFPYSSCDASSQRFHNCERRVAMLQAPP
jgi:broad specificity phosphatase PhoE